MSANVVPFGKYKGQAVEQMLADHEYMAWVEAQPWFRDRYLHLLSRRDADAASRTPVHNKLQTLFLDTAYQHAFLHVASSSYREAMEAVETFPGDAIMRAEKAGRILAAKLAEVEALESGKDPDYRYETRSFEAAIYKQDCALQKFLDTSQTINHKIEINFENAGRDVVLRWQTMFPEFAEFYLSERGSYLYWGPNNDAKVWEKGYYETFGIEIKPSIADEYPAVLRQMKRNDSNVLFAGTYAAEGASEAQFIAMFAASGIQVVFKRDVDRVVAETLLARLDAAGIGLILQPSGKATVMPGPYPMPELMASARVHRDAIMALLLERAQGIADVPAPVQDDTL